MIELVSSSRCIGCDVCIRVCPKDVFDHGPGRIPVIARQEDCQTCFLCEAWCPADALFVAPQTTPAPAGSRYRDEEALAEDGLLGSYRRELGWGKGQAPGAGDDLSHVVIPLLH
ncbi:ferredoxin family protein [Patulibacter sp. NPDC049589]|uniref:ferredoxin family protein n=1 Tax=Patulibacter sp. NPDC049589 TaxID=3154731 RepID=UPI00342C5A8E